MRINITKLYENFINIKNVANLNLLICYEELFTKEGILYNVGSYIILSSIIIHLISAFIFYLKQLNIIKIKIREIFFAINNNKLLKHNKN